MNDHARAWVAALRSGEFKQGHNTLRSRGEDGPRHCCLGVACELYLRETGSGRWDGDEFLAGGDVGVGVLPRHVQGWIGLGSASGLLPLTSTGLWDSLTKHNDDGESFDLIAALIESEPEGLFT